MIKCKDGVMEAEGAKMIIMAEYMVITKALAMKFGNDDVMRAFAICDEFDDSIYCMDGFVGIPKTASHTMVGLAMILNSITEAYGEKTEIIIKSAADLAMEIKPDGCDYDFDVVEKHMKEATENLGDV